MQPILHLSISILLLGACISIPAECTPLPDAPSNSTPCSIDVNQICSSVAETANYSIRLTTYEFHNLGQIKAQVYGTQCSLTDAPVPWWYQVEVFETLESGSGNGEGSGSVAQPRRAGEFRIPQGKHEMTMCNQDSTMVFSPCNPTLFDLPQDIVWTASKHYNSGDSLCFRLTLQLNGDTSCGQREVCVSVGDIPRTLASSVDDEGQSSGAGSNNYDTAPYVHIASEPVGSGHLETVDSNAVDDEDILEMIKETYNLKDSDLSAGIPTNKGCLMAQEFYKKNKFSWIPDCTCGGDYKSVQCVGLEEGEPECWCSSPGGSEIKNSRKTLSCVDPSSLVFQC